MQQPVMGMDSICSSVRRYFYANEPSIVDCAFRTATMVAPIYSPLFLLVYFYLSTLLPLLTSLHLPRSLTKYLLQYIYWLLMHT